MGSLRILLVMVDELDFIGYRINTESTVYDIPGISYNITTAQTDIDRDSEDMYFFVESNYIWQGLS